MLSSKTQKLSYLSFCERQYVSNNKIFKELKKWLFKYRYASARFWKSNNEQEDIQADRKAISCLREYTLKWI